MTQNTSGAVMAQRREPHDSLDDFPTPPWGTRALCEHLIRRGHRLDIRTVREPAANRGHMVRPLSEAFASVDASDIHDYGAGFRVDDYLFGPPPAPVDWTITNPPFRLAEAFIERAEATSLQGFAVLVRTSFVEGVGRFKSIYQVRPPSLVLQFTERLPMHRGKLAPDGSTATSYCWMVWETEMTGRNLYPEIAWTGVCRRRLERAGDYQGQS